MAEKWEDKKEVRLTFKEQRDAILQKSFRQGQCIRMLEHALKRIRLHEGQRLGTLTEEQRMFDGTVYRIAQIALQERSGE